MPSNIKVTLEPEKWEERGGSHTFSRLFGNMSSGQYITHVAASLVMPMADKWIRSVLLYNPNFVLKSVSNQNARYISYLLVAAYQRINVLSRIWSGLRHLDCGKSDWGNVIWTWFKKEAPAPHLWVSAWPPGRVALLAMIALGWVFTFLMPLPTELCFLSPCYFCLCNIQAKLEGAVLLRVSLEWSWRWWWGRGSGFSLHLCLHSCV